MAKQLNFHKTESDIEKLYELPEGWAWCRLGEVTQFNPRHLLDIVPEDAEVSFVPMSAIDEDSWEFREMRTEPFGEVKRGYTHFAEGDVLFAKITPCMENGKAAIAKGLINGIGCGTTELHVIRPKTGITSEFIYYHVHQESFREKAAAHMTGTAGQLRVAVSFMKETPIPLPPLPEQHLIVARVEVLLGRVRKAKEAIEKVPQIMKRFRQAVLKKAFSGELTAEWRAQQQDLEPAAELLKHIQEERKQRYEEEVKRAKAEGRKPPRKPRCLEMEPLDTSDLPELPEEWVWCRLGELTSTIEYGYTEKAVGSPIGPKFLRITDIQNDAVDWENVPYCAPPKDSKEYHLSPGDILIARTGATTGKHYLIRQCPEAIFASYLIRLRTAKGVLPEFASKFMDSELYWRQIAEDQKGTAQPGANATVLSNLAFPFPPLREQQEIVRRVGVLFKFAGEMEKRVEEARKRVEKITQSVLAWAFRGELTADFREAVKNWRNLDPEERKKYLFTLPEGEREEALYRDEFPLEPAERLLERIREAREKRK